MSGLTGWTRRADGLRSPASDAWRKRACRSPGGIPIGVNPLWLLIVALITWSLGASYYPDQVSWISPATAYGLGLASALLLFASIVLHELGHALVARWRGVSIKGIDLWLLGGVAKLRGSPHDPGDELRYATAGPAVTAGVALVFGVMALVMPDTTPDAPRALIDYQLYVNVAMLAFNLLPASPLDGGTDPAGAGLGPGRGHGPGDLDRGRRRRRWPPSGATATTPSR